MKDQTSVKRLVLCKFRFSISHFFGSRFFLVPEKWRHILIVVRYSPFFSNDSRQYDESAVRDFFSYYFHLFYLKIAHWTPKKPLTKILINLINASFQPEFIVNRNKIRSFDLILRVSSFFVLLNNTFIFMHGIETITTTNKNRIKHNRRKRVVLITTNHVWSKFYIIINYEDLHCMFNATKFAKRYHRSHLNAQLQILLLFKK